MFNFLVTVAMFFHGSKIPTTVLCKVPQGTFKQSLVLIGQVVLEEKIFENCKQQQRITLDAK